MWFWIVQLVILAGIPFANSATQNTNAGTILGCAPKQENLKEGFSISYYHYPMVPKENNPRCFTYDTTYRTDEYLHGGYQTFGGGLLGTSSGVVDLTFRSTVAAGCSKPLLGNLPSNYNYKDQLTQTNFSMLITGYFLAPKTGSYDFILDYIDDLAYMNIGAGRAFGCCQLGSTVSNPGPFDLSVMWPQTENTATVNLLGGFYYPIRIFFINRLGLGGLTVSFKDPDGVTHTTFDNYIFTVPDGEVCPVPIVTTTMPWTAQSTTTVTTIGTITGQDGKPTPENIIIVKTPEVQQATTVFTPWTGTTTATIATDVTTTTGADGIETVKTIYHVETPEVDQKTTVFTPWTGTITSTIATDVTTTTGADGIPTVKTIYHVETPEVDQKTTVFTPWTGTITSTFATDVTTTTGKDGIPTVKTIYHVETPEVDQKTTTEFQL
ncbi:GLEYA domain-containing protein [Kluyveromyces marxianus]